MEDITKFKLPSGEIVYVETESAASGESRAAIQTLFGTSDQPPTELKDKFRPVVEALQTLRSEIVAMKPDEVVLEASVKFVGSAGVILAKYGSEAGVSVKLKWTSGKHDKGEE
jgi:hypothetical protein